MMNRINLKFKQLRKKKKKALIVYIMAGHSSISLTEKLVLSLEKCGVDLIELGVPFSDPLADGPIIQEADTYTLNKGVNLGDVLNLAKRLRKKTEIPLILMLYYNLILNFGEEKFVRKATACGIDGIIVPDLPVEEARNLISISRRRNLATIFFVTPTSSSRRMKLAIANSSGFIYYIARTGVTGKKTDITSAISTHVRRIRKISRRPVCVGFGIKTASQIKSIARFADGAIVGSAVVKIISRTMELAAVKKVSKFVRGLSV